ncbi:MAG: hypothetical protein Q3966_10055 [Neisseria sp.]|nr:hypothetical protein [Neisseria sp.]
MLGWWISVYREGEGGEVTPFADWECGLGGTDWLDGLCKNGQAVQTQNRGGYPDLYEVEARYVAPWLADGKIPDGGGIAMPVFMENDDGETVSMRDYGYRPLKLENVQTLRNLPPDAVLTVRVFDLS